ncbi:MAG TPA: WYL domain-containing protein, partial [Ktedonobacterales bacterium]|nr:WYL domain-containing protein [Ktedonobacterales bacterium]
MNRTDRMLAIVLELQGRGRARAEDLAQTFETSKRTIYRDMLALGQAGVPIVSIPGRGFSLVEGYFLPPLSFTADEATLLLLGADVMAQSFDTRYRAAAQSASRKIAGALPERQRAAVQALRESIHFVASEHRFSPIPEALQQLRSAILSRRTVRFAYYARRSQSAHDDARLAATGALPTPGLREADPYALAHVSGAWYLLAWDHQRRAMRNFRLDRMDDLTTLDTTFTRQPDRQRLQRDIEETATLTARVLFAPEVARWVREAPSFFAVALEDTP